MSDEESGVMEKQPPRQTPGQYKNNGVLAERRNDFPSNRNGRNKRGPRPQESLTPTARPMQKWTKANSDKRPKPRGSYHDRCREELAEEEPSLEEEPLYAGTSRKGNGNHLLNFKYDNGGAHSHRVNLSYYKGATRHHNRYKAVRYNKEQFLQASYQFVVQSKSHVQPSVNPDSLVPWDIVELVRSHISEEVHCSICLMPPMAGKITKCGHTFCWACILHYLSTAESDRQGCPLCHQYIASEDLRSIQHIPVPQVKEGEQIEMKLMRKNKGSLYVCPHSQWVDRDGMPLNIQDGQATAFNKVLVASSDQIYSDVIEREKTALEVQLSEAEDYELGYVVMAQDLLKKREMELKKDMRNVSTSSSTTVEEEPLDPPPVQQEPPVPLPPDKSFDGSQIATTYADAFEDEALSDSVWSLPKPRQESVGEETIPFELMHEDSSLSDTRDRKSLPGARQSETTSEAGDLTELSDQLVSCGLLGAGVEEGSLPAPESTMTASEAADHLELPHEFSPDTKVQGRRAANKSKNVYYFYQASSGQHIYLNSLNVQCLVKEYGSLENSPDTITATVVAIDRIFINEEMRKRFRYLNHIPLTCEVQIAELKLHHPVVSKETLKSFHAEFEKRRKMRQRKLKAEKLRARHYEAEQRKKAHEYYHSYTIVQSDQFPHAQSSPDLAASQGQTPEAHAPVTFSTGESDSSPPPQAWGGEEGSPSTKSFAQIIRSGGHARGAPGATAVVWPVLSSSASAPVLHGQAGRAPQEREEEEEEGRPPSYADSMMQSWQNVQFKQAQKSDKDKNKSPKQGKGKGRKKEGMTTLFATGMARRM